MLNEGYKVLIKKAKEIYKGIKCIECPALNNEKYFLIEKDSSIYCIRRVIEEIRVIRLTD